ncbi:Avt7 protein [Martiniozyma asiatica (nom. inval.)]|nr:Avt7 protein [Martiniozyma asiatica]
MATVFSSVVNTVNTIIGSGILVLPYAFRTDSMVLGIFVLVLAGAANGFGMLLQGAASKYMAPRSATFFSVCKITYPKLSILFDLSIFLQCFGVCISYLVLIGDILPLIYTFNNWDESQMRLVYIFSSTIITIPLCFMKKLDSLKYTSFIALAAIVYLVLLIYGNFVYAWTSNWEDIPKEKIGEISYFKPEGITSIFKTLGVIVLAYTCPNQFSIISELSNPSMKRIGKITYISLSITFGIFLTVALTGYLTFGNAIPGNILLMYENNIWTQMGRLLLVLMVALSYPLMFHPSRISFNNIYHSIEKEMENIKVDDSTPLIPSVSGEDHTVPFPNLRFYIFTIILLVSSYAGAIILTSFELILSIVGSTGGVLICFILPGAYGWKLLAPENYPRFLEFSPEESSGSYSWFFTSSIVRYSSLFLIIWGILVMIVCLWSTVFA